MAIYHGPSQADSVRVEMQEVKVPTKEKGVLVEKEDCIFALNSDMLDGGLKTK